MQAAIYARISQDRSGEALGVARQERLCRELAERLGWTVAETYVDNDVSAFTGHPRPQYVAMLDAARAGQVDAIVCLDTDRLTRHPRELEDVIDLAEGSGIRLANVSGRIDLATSEGRLLARITGAVARQESERKSERTQRKMIELAQQGKWAGGPRRFGYTEGMAEVVEVEADAIRQAAADILDRDVSWRQVARDWNAAGVLTPRGNEWRPSSVKRTMTAAFLAGLRMHRGEIVGEAEWPAILDRATHARLVALTRQGRPHTYATRMLTGILVCGRCGTGLTASQTDNARRIYRCKPEPGEGTCGNLSLSAEPAEAAVRDMVLDALAGRALAAAVAADTDEQHADAIAALDELADRKREAAEMFATGDIGRSEWEAVRSKIEEQSEAVSATLAAPAPADGLVDELADADDLAALWDGADDDQWRRQVVQLLVDRIVVHPAAIRQRTFDPARLEPMWKV